LRPPVRQAFPLAPYRTVLRLLSLAAGQQPGAQLRFQLLHLGAERRLGNVQSVRCPGEMEVFRDRHEIVELPGIEHRGPPMFNLCGD
jgi:hypothetical protein